MAPKRGGRPGAKRVVTSIFTTLLELAGMALIVYAIFLFSFILGVASAGVALLILSWRLA
jgi:hypothetical protein